MFQYLQDYAYLFIVSVSFKFYCYNVSYLKDGPLHTVILSVSQRMVRYILSVSQKEVCYKPLLSC